MILLDTNVVSEGFRIRPNAMVAAWTDAQPSGSLYLCTPVLAEMRFGVELLADGRRKDDLQLALDRIEYDLFVGRILPFDVAAAKEYARLSSDRQKMGRRIDVMDALVAAVARSQGATLATRNVSHFADISLSLINPFEAIR